MDPKSNNTPGLHLPQPSMAQPTGFEPAPELPVKPEVQAIIEPPRVSAEPMMQPIQHYQPPVQPLNTPIEASQPESPVNLPANPASVTQDISEEAADEEWIAKARTIAEQYKNDPFLQSAELSRLKADYLQARHGKIVKVNDSAA